LNSLSIEFPVEGLVDGELRLRLLAEADLPALVEAVQDPEIPRWTRIPAPYGEREAVEWYAAQRDGRDRGAMLNLVIVDARDDRLLGSIGMVDVNWEESRCELGYWMAAAERGRGIMSRAIWLLSRWAFEQLEMERVSICADVDNVASRRAAERAGFTYEGVLRSWIEIKGERRDMASYSLLRGELPAEQGDPPPDSGPTLYADSG
jgi:RimJ/RimL family protein N-acetyltransferase